MNYYFAPLEGITGFLYRNTYEKHFGGVSKYFSPFIATNQHYGMQNKEKRDVLPANNKEYYLVPQIMSNKADQFVDMAKKLKDLGYQEVNLNLGCPSKTVVTKKKGSGFLAYPEELHAFFSEVFEHLTDVEVSVKTRIGMEQAEEFERLLEIYNEFPLKELIVHPRLQIDLYKNHPNMEVFDWCVENAKAPLCYNGDLYTVEDLKAFEEKYPTVKNVMLGRGLLRTPSLLSELSGKERDLNKWYEFLMELCDVYERELSGEMNVLYKMKEHWYYLFQGLSVSDKEMKTMRKTKDLDSYKLLVKSILR